MQETTAIFGVYRTAREMGTGVEALREAGFRHENVSVLLSEAPFPKELVQEKESNAGEESAPEVVIESVLGGQSRVRIVMTSEKAPLIAAGALMAGLAGFNAGGALGGITGALTRMGVPEFEAKRYETGIQEGGILLAVELAAPDRIETVQEVLKRTGAQDISFTLDIGSGLAESNAPAPTALSASEPI